MIEIIVPGEPVGKGRPKFRRAGNYVQTYTPEKTAVYENLIKVEYIRQSNGVRFEEKVPIKMNIEAVMSIPASKSKKEKALMEEKKVLPVKKPDLDNICKAVCDALNKVAYYDDSQIVNIKMNKSYGVKPYLKIQIERV